jgi:hypothetical protein
VTATTGGDGSSAEEVLGGFGDKLLVEGCRLLGGYLSDSMMQALCASLEAVPGAARATDWRYVTGLAAQSKAAVKPSAPAKAATASKAGPKPAGGKASDAIAAAVASAVEATGGGGTPEDVARFVSPKPALPVAPGEAAGGGVAKRRASGGGIPSKKLKGVDTTGMRSMKAFFGKR